MKEKAFGPLTAAVVAGAIVLGVTGYGMASGVVFCAGGLVLSVMYGSKAGD